MIQFVSILFLTYSAPTAAPTQVQGEAIDSTSIRINWNPPPDDKQNGVILGYRILHSIKESGSSTDITQSVTADELTLVIRNLLKWTEYKFQVAAYTHLGDGPKSAPIFVQTKEDGMLPEKNLNSLSIPHFQTIWKCTVPMEAQSTLSSTHG